MKLTRGFVQGIMNKDLDERLLPPGQYRDALNVGVSTSTESDVGAIENQLGNTNKSNLTLHASAKTIGAIADEANFNIYWFVTSDTFDYVFRYNQNTELTITLLKDTAGRLLNFDAAYLITGINIINDLLFWTDNLNPPRRLNVTRNYATDGFTEDDISVIVKPPLFAPTIRLEETVDTGFNISGEENNIEDTFIEFSYRYKYENNEYSAMAPFSSHAFYPGTYSYNYADWELTSMLNIYNKANVRFHLGGDQVKEVQLLYKESQSTNINIIESFPYSAPYDWNFDDNAQAGAYAAAVTPILTSAFPGNVAFTTSTKAPFSYSGVNIPPVFEVGDEIFIAQTAGFTYSVYEGYHTIVEILDEFTIVIDVAFAGASGVEPGVATIETKEKPFINNKIYTVLPSDELGRLFDNVPLKAQAQDLIGSRVAYGNYVQFFDLIGSNSQPIEVDYTLYLDSVEISGVPLPTFRSDRDYEVGIAYLDDYGRMTTVLTSEQNTLHIPPENSETANNIGIEINNLPPAFASHFRFFIKQSKGDYETVFPLYFYQDGIARWFAIGPGDINKVKKDEYIICKTNGSVATTSVEKYKVIEVDSKGVDFLANGATQLSGVYFKINDSKNIFNSSAQFTHTFAGQGTEIWDTNLAAWYFLNDVNTTGQASFSYLPNGIINVPVFYGSSSVATSLILTASSGYSAHETNLGSSGLSYRLRIEIEDGPGNKFKYSKMSQDGVATLIQDDVTMLNTIPGNELSDANGLRLANIRFGHLPNQYNTGDYWMISIHSMYAGSLDHSLDSVFTGGSVIDEPVGVAVAICQGNTWDVTPALASPPFNDRAIEAGARLEFTIEQKDRYGVSFPTPTKSFYSSKRYANIEEWFWGDNVASSFSQLNFDGGDDGGQRVIFKRGIFVETNSVITSAPHSHSVNNNQMFQANGLDPISTGFSSYASWEDNIAMAMPVRMCIVGSKPPDWTFNSGVFNNQIDQTNAATITVDFKIIQSPDLVIFETTPELNPPDIYHELNETFKITNGFHVGNLTTQSVGVPATVSLNTAALSSATTKQKENSNFNAYAFGNGLEALRIRGDWNSYPLMYSPRASGVIDDYQQQRVKEAITYSGVYRENTGINNLNEFNLSLGNFKYLDRFFGSIQKLYARDTDLVVFQQNKVSKVLYGKNLLSDSAGGGNIASIPQVLGTQIAYAGEYGISDNPESFDYWGNNMFFTDLKRGAVIKLGIEGVIPISSLGMIDFFKDFSISGATTQKIGAVDPFKEQYVITTNDVELPCIFSVVIKGSLKLSNPFYVSSQAIVVCATITASGNWTVSLVDTGDGTGWVLINNVAGTSLTGTGNAVVCFHYAANTTGADRSLRIVFSGCADVLRYTALQSKLRPIEVVGYVIGNIRPTEDDPICEAEDTLEADQAYDFTSNTGPDIEFKSTKFKRGQISLTTKSTGLAGQEAIPSPGDTVEIKANALGTTTQRPFSSDLGNQMRYYVSNTYYGPEDIDDLLAASSLLVPVLAVGVYTGSFTYAAPGDESYLYLIWDYTNKVAAGSTISLASGSEGTTYAQIDYAAAIGRSTLQYNAGVTTNRFIVKYGGKTALDTGFVAGIGTVDLIKNLQGATKACLIVETSALDDGWSVQVGALSLTSFLLDLNNDNIATVCARVPATTKYHDGFAALPVAGDTIYNEADGATKYDGATAYHKMGAGDDYAFVDENGLVMEVGSCAACAETAAPVLTIPDFTFTIKEQIDIKLTGTNNPIQWELVSACQSYSLAGNDSGGVFTATSCDGSGGFEIQVPANISRVICSLTTPVKVTGDAVTSTLLGVCNPEILPPGLTLKAREGRIIGSTATPGTYRVTVNATNCFGTSADMTFIITVAPETEYRRFNLNTDNPQSNPSDACGITPVFEIYYHSGNSEYPVENDTVFYITNRGTYLPYNGGYLWFLMENGTAIRIDSAGQVVDESVCGSTKTTEGGDDKTTEADLDKTIE